MRFLALIFGEGVWAPYSVLIAFILRAKGAKVGRGFKCQGTPTLKLRGKAANLVIGEDVLFAGDVDLRNRENGKIVIGDRCKIDQRVRLVAANDASLTIGSDTNIGAYSIFNCGTDVTLGSKCLVAGFVYVQSSNHGLAAGRPIKEQPHTHEPITIGDDVWIGGHVSVLAGARIGTGAVIGANAVVTGEIPSGSIAYGVPARAAKQRSAS